ncbi:ABC-2 family transporter protein [Candidatus Curtissbacteria bacterium]|nr:ABC-2 family transporter protein [Candidatus Curtissbacteria bacterium]
MTTYRLNFALWRLRVNLQLLTMYFLWLAILPEGARFASYDQSLMLTYILGGGLLSAMIISSRSQGVGDHITSGDLSNYLLRPINYFAYWFAQDIADKAMNITFAVFELTLLFFILKPPLFIQTDTAILLLSALAAAVAMLLYFFLNFLIGLVGFWSPEVWAPRFIFIILLTFAAGGLFPLDILPPPVYEIFKFLPTTYLIFFPLKVYLGQLTPYEITMGLTAAIIWLVLLYLIVKFVYMSGLKIYSAYGK